MARCPGFPARWVVARKILDTRQRSWEEAQRLGHCGDPLAARHQTNRVLFEFKRIPRPCRLRHYGAYRDYERRQRCIVHLIRKGWALAGGLHPDGVRIGEWLTRELRNLIRVVAEDKDHTILNPIQARLKRACKLYRDHDTEKIRQLAREILNDWPAIVAFVSNPLLPPTNNEEERALRTAVIARRLSFGTRTKEGRAAYAASLSIIETCRRRRVDPWSFLADVLAPARQGLVHNPVPAAA